MRDGPSQTRYSKVLINKLITVSDTSAGRSCAVYSRAQQRPSYSRRWSSGAKKFRMGPMTRSKVVRVIARHSMPCRELERVSREENAVFYK